MRPLLRCLMGFALASVGCAPSPPATELSPYVPGAQRDAASVADAGSTAADGDATASGDSVTHLMDDGGASTSSDAEAASATADTAPADGGAEAASTTTDSGIASTDGGADSSVYMGPARPPAACRPSDVWGAGVALDVSTALDDMLDSVTPDELSIAWTIGHGSTATVAYADRPAIGSAFGAAQMLSPGPFAVDRAALSPDGLRLVVVNADGHGFSELTRTSRTAPGNVFGSPVTGSYSNVNAAGALSAGESYGDPVVGSDDVAFFYSVAPGGITPTIFRTARLLSTEAWPVGAAVQVAANAPLGGRPTGISSDGRTLFLNASGMEVAAWQDDSTGDFSTSISVSPRASAVPSGDCQHLYYSAPGASSVDLFVASH